MRTVGIDIGLHAVKIAVLEGSAKRPKLVRFIDHRLPEGRTTRALESAELGGLILGLLDRHKLAAEETIADIPGASCLLRDIQVPFTRADQIQKTIKFQAESAFQSIQIDDMAIDWYKVDEIGSRSRLIVIACRKDIVERRLDALQVAGIDPAALDLDSGALYNAFIHCTAGKPEKRTLLVDLGGGSVKIIVVEEGRIRAIRAFRASAGELKVDEKRRQPTDLDELRAGLGSRGGDDAFFVDDEGRLPVVILDEEQSALFDFDSDESRRSVLEKVFFEIDRTMARAILSGPIEQVVLTGGGAESPGIAEAFAERYEVDCERLHVGNIALSRLPKDERAPLERVGATALGLALKGIGVDHGGIDLRQDELRFAGKLEQLKSGLACTLVLMFVLFFLVAYRYQNIEAGRLYTKQRFVQQYQGEIYQQVFGEAPRGNPLLSLRQRERELTQRLGQDTPDVVSALDMLRDVARATKETGKEVELRDLSFRQGQATMQIQVPDRSTLFDIESKLDEGDYLVTLDRMRDDVDRDTGRYNATLTLTVREPEQPDPRAPRGAAPGRR